MGDFGAVRSRLNRAGWDEVALAGIADLPWHELSGILRSAVGDLSFANELQLRALVSEASRKEDMSNRSFALQPVAFHKDGAGGMGMIQRPPLRLCCSGKLLRSRLPRRDGLLDFRGSWL